jgi:hypothetical protein
MVHSGSSDVGHYHSFVYDRKANKWYRFNDYKVSLETEERVMQESMGDSSAQYPTCAYTLIYVNKDIAEVQRAHSLEEFNAALCAIVPEEFKKDIESENRNFAIESTNFKVDISVQNIISLFNKRHDKISKILFNSTFQFKELVNFNTYLNGQNKKLGLAKWVLLNQCFRECLNSG